MLLKSIEIQGFKSFADKTVLQFGPGVTAVVGPNGSGKSNITDAVRWVLGEQSTKSLRGQAMEDVIFSGTAARRPHGFAEVTLTIDNSDRTLNFDQDTVAITRRYYRSHESEYQINKAVVRLKDVHELFMDTGLGRDGYSMIGQGKIDSIVSSKSNERRDIFEEASGISRYRYRKIEAQRRLALADDNLLRLKDILSELEGRVGPLAEQSKKAEKFLKLAEEKKSLEIGLWLHMLDRSNDALRAQENKITIAQAQYEEIAKALAELEEQIESGSESFNLLTAQMDEIHRETGELEEAAVRKEGEIAVLQNSLQFNNESVARIEGDIALLDQSEARAARELEQRKQQIAEKEALLAEKKEQVQAVSEELTGLLSQSENISRQIEEFTKLLNLLSAAESEQRVKMVTAESSLAEIATRRDTVVRLAEERKAQLEQATKELDELNADLDALEDTIKSNENALQGYTLKRNTRAEGYEKQKQECDNARLDIEEKKRRARILEDLERSLEGFGHSVKAVMKQAESGVLKGIHGPVTRIISVSKEYATAVEVALGAATQHIVVDTDGDAKRAIQMLKSGNLGRATFLPLNSVRPRRFEEKGLEDQYGFVGVAAEVVQADAKYADIISSLLGNTVLAEDIDAAATIACKYGYRFKVVSLDGQVVNAGGSFTGGSLGKHSGLLSRAGDIEKLEKEAAALEEKLQRKLLLLQQDQEQLASLDAEILALQSENTTANEDKIRLLGELKRVGELCNTYRAEMEDMQAEQGDIEARKADLTAQIAEATAEIERIAKQKSQKQTEIETMSGGRDSATGRREELSAQLTDLRLQIVEAEKDIQAVEASVAQMANATQDRLQKTEEYRGQIAELQAKNSELNQQITALQEEMEAARRKKTVLEQTMEDIRNQRDSSDKQAQEMRRTEREKTLERERVSGEVERLKERKETMLHEYDDIIKRLYDEYEMTRSDAEALGVQIENPAEAKRALGEIKGKIRGLGNVNVAAIEEYKEVSERYEFLSAQLADVNSAREELNRLIDQLTGKMKELFVEGFEKINSHFSQTFTELFGGGTAKLVLTDPDNVLESGIDIDAKLPGKNVPSLDGLSGGEKALIAICIYFSIMRVNAPPFCFLDEVDTALDDINVERFAQYMKKSNLSTQFVCVTHRRGTMETADMLYGVTMQEKGVSKLLQLNVEELVKTLNLDNAR